MVAVGSSYRTAATCSRANFFPVVKSERAVVAVTYGSGISTMAFSGLGLATGMYALGSNLLSTMIVAVFALVLTTVAGFRVVATVRNR